jgi:hypothetical protein
MPFDDEEKLKLKGEVHQLVASRDQKHQSNFVEVHLLSRPINSQPSLGISISKIPKPKPPTWEAIPFSLFTQLPRIHPPPILLDPCFLD